MPKVSAEYRDARRTHVLEAARRCFVRDGFHSTSMADVCREAGVSSGVVYLYFTSKDDIIAAIAAQNLDGIVAAAEQLALQHRDQGAGVVLAELLDHIRSAHERDRLASIALLTWSESLRNGVLAQRLAEASAEVRGLFAALLRETGDASRPGSLSAEATAAVFSSILVGYVMQLATQPADATEPVPHAVKALWAEA